MTISQVHRNFRDFACKILKHATLVIQGEQV